MRPWSQFSVSCLCMCLLCASRRVSEKSPQLAAAAKPSLLAVPRGLRHDAACATAAARGAAARSVRTKREILTAYSSFTSTESIAEFRQHYAHLSPGERAAQKTVRVAGRVTSMRDMGKIFFFTISSNGAELQVVGQVGEHFTHDGLKKVKTSMRVGDIVGAVGVPSRMQKGELSVSAFHIVVLCPYVCADQVVCPNLRGFNVLQDNDVKYRYRFVDMMTNPVVIDTIKKRHEILRALREYLNSRGFVEVETPILHTVASGANAKPFLTHHNANEADLYLRVAPELHLKQCVVGGMERVYEIGKVFRNEDSDCCHNPEFTSCEFYAAYQTYEDLIPLTESIFSHLAISAGGTTVVQVSRKNGGGGGGGASKACTLDVDLGRPFRRVSVYDEVQKASGVELPPPNELNTPKGLAYMSAIMLRYNIPLPSVRTAAKMFDKLIEFFITDHIVQPTFVMDHPLFMSPLAKEHASKPGLSERFELFINGVEYCNAYSELNNPQEQYLRFQQQLMDRQQGGDEEAMPLDETFLKSLQVGLPPTAGWGMGVDRLVMLLTNSTTIRDGIIFPLLRQDVGSHDCKRRCRTASFFDFNKQMTLFCLSGLEQELKRNGFSEQSAVHIRELQRTIIEMGQRGGAGGRDIGDIRGGLWPEWRTAVTLAMIRLICGTPRV